MSDRWSGISSMISVGVSIASELPKGYSSLEAVLTFRRRTSSLTPPLTNGLLAYIVQAQAQRHASTVVSTPHWNEVLMINPVPETTP